MTHLSATVVASSHFVYTFILNEYIYILHIFIFHVKGTLTFLRLKTPTIIIYYNMKIMFQFHNGISFVGHFRRECKHLFSDFDKYTPSEKIISKVSILSMFRSRAFRLIYFAYLPSFVNFYSFVFMIGTNLKIYQPTLSL